MRKLTQEEFVLKASELHKGKYSYTNTIYTRSADKVAVSCPLHGTFYVTANNHISKSNLCGCPDCFGNRKIDNNYFLFMAKGLHGDKYDYSKVNIINNTTRVSIRCPTHGVFTQTPSKHLSGRGCQQCGGTQRKDIQNVLRKAEEIHSNYYNYEQVSPTARYTDKVPISCPKHGVFLQTLKQHVLHKQGCSSCSNTKSAQEKIIANMLRTYTSVEVRNRTIISPKEIDIWLPELNIGIEYHGLYWHTSDRIGKYAHRDKWERTNQQGVRLIQIFEDEWMNKRDIVISRLLAIIGQSQRIMARKTTVNSIEFKEARLFLDTHHIQGAGPASKAYGLKYDGVLVAVATFCKARSGGMVFDGSDAWEVCRYASEGTVVGGFSKLFKAFRLEYAPKKVISYCDLRYGNGGLYAATDFILDSVTEPDYWWLSTKGKERIPRYQIQKHKLAKHPILSKYYSPEKTENEICMEAGWLKIYGVGNQKWVWKSLDIPHQNVL